MSGVHRTSDGWKKCVAKTPETCRVVFEGGPAAHAASMEEGLENEAKELEKRNKETQLSSARKFSKLPDPRTFKLDDPGPLREQSMKLQDEKDPEKKRSMLNSLAVNPASDSMTLHNVYKNTDDDEVKKSLLKHRNLDPTDTERIVEDSFGKNPEIVDVALKRKDLNQETIDKIIRKGLPEQYRKASAIDLRRSLELRMKTTKVIDSSSMETYTKAADDRDRFSREEDNELQDTIRSLVSAHQDPGADPDYIQSLEEKVRRQMHQKNKDRITADQAKEEMKLRHRRENLYPKMSKSDLEDVRRSLSRPSFVNVASKNDDSVTDPYVEVEVEMRNVYRKRELDEVNKILKRRFM